MKQNTYIPKPVDTSDVQLPEELEMLVEQMSKNVHDVWAETRIAQGWSYGEKRDDAQKLHPCLVPYEELPDSDLILIIDDTFSSEPKRFFNSIKTWLF